MDTTEKGIKAFTPDDVFRKFLTEGRKIKCECSPDQESITMNQALRYTTAWGVLRVNLLEGQKINRGKEASIVDALVDGIRPLHFRRAIRDAVEKLRTVERQGMLETTENTPEEDTQDRVSAYFVQEVVALASMASTYETRLGKRHSSNSSVEETEKTFTPPTIPTSYTTSIPQPSQNPQGQNPVTYRLPVTATPAFASEGGFEKTQRRRPYPTCIFCQYSNHWCWECDHMGGRRLPRGAGQKKVTPEAWQRYGQIIADKRPDLRAKFDEFA
ncbi:hypothetical protein ADUPG1_003088, partial [Aduncisulcus paluster]